MERCSNQKFALKIIDKSKCVGKVSTEGSKSACFKLQSFVNLSEKALYWKSALLITEVLPYFFGYY